MKTGDRNKLLILLLLLGLSYSCLQGGNWKSNSLTGGNMVITQYTGPASEAVPTIPAGPVVDTDGDGIPDATDTDDDDDAYTDDEEIAAGTDPLDPDDFPEAPEGHDFTLLECREHGELFGLNGFSESADSDLDCHKMSAIHCEVLDKVLDEYLYTPADCCNFNCTTGEF